MKSLSSCRAWRAFSFSVMSRTMPRIIFLLSSGDLSRFAVTRQWMISPSLRRMRAAKSLTNPCFLICSRNRAGSLLSTKTLLTLMAKTSSREYPNILSSAGLKPVILPDMSCIYTASLMVSNRVRYRASLSLSFRSSLCLCRAISMLVTSSISPKGLTRYPYDSTSLARSTVSLSAKAVRNMTGISYCALMVLVNSIPSMPPLILMSMRIRSGMFFPMAARASWALAAVPAISKPRMARVSLIRSMVMSSSSTIKILISIGSSSARL